MLKVIHGQQCCHRTVSLKNHITTPYLSTDKHGIGKCALGNLLTADSTSIHLGYPSTTVGGLSICQQYSAKIKDLMKVYKIHTKNPLSGSL